MGARCVANTFDGERCLYASLNVGIRNLLRDHKVVHRPTPMRRDGYDRFLRRCLDDRQHCDITFAGGRGSAGTPLHSWQPVLSSSATPSGQSGGATNCRSVLHTNLVDASVFESCW
uniref:Putative ankyrin repeat and btb poz domain protein n=1 Tax=Ixodes ricinus TaxID=34613 RepID=A0A0K8RCV6_IXORI